MSNEKFPNYDIFFTLEETNINPISYMPIQYRFRSLFNGSVGSWCYSREKAMEQGEKHTTLIQKLFSVFDLVTLPPSK